MPIRNKTRPLVEIVPSWPPVDAKKTIFATFQFEIELLIIPISAI